MRVLFRQYRAAWMLALVAVPLFAYDFAPVRWVAVARPIDFSRPNITTATFRVRHAARHLVEIGVAGPVDACILNHDEPRCAKVPSQLDVTWRVTENGRTVLDGRSDAGPRGSWGSSDGRRGTILGDFPGRTDAQYEITLTVRSPGPDLVVHQPILSVSVGPEQRDRDLGLHALAFWGGILIAAAALGVARNTKRRAERLATAR